MTIDTPKFRIEARAQWRDKGKPASRNTLVTAVNPGDSTSDWQSEKVRSVDELRKLFKDANAKKMVTLLVESNFSSLVFPNNREIDFLSVEFKEWQGKTAILTPTCNDLKVVKNMASTAEKKQNVVTLKISGDKGFANM
jgi:hypothetical protein